MRRARRVFTAEFRAEAVRLATESEQPLRQIARDLGIHPVTLRSWRDQAAAAHAAPAPAVTAEEIRRLQRENAVLREEREILKKATAFFAKDAR